jgi:hypothetical protein
MTRRRDILVALSAAPLGACVTATAPAASVAPRSLREALPVLARHEGVWRGVFRRYGADGALMESFASEITTLFPAGAAVDYQQTNRYVRPGQADLVIQSEGVFDGERLRFENARVRGWAMDDPTDLNRRSVSLFLLYADGSTYVHETIQISDDGARRYRATQYFSADGALQRRTMIDEERIGSPVAS